MKLFLDSANLQEIEECLKLGFISGITTNPSIISKEPKGDFLKHIEKIVNLCNPHTGYVNAYPISVEVFANEPGAMLAQAEHFFTVLGGNANKIVIKIPIGWENLRVIKELSKHGIPVNCTCCFTENQCILAVNAGARYVSIFWGRSKDILGDPRTTVQNIRTLLSNFDSETEIIVGSIRSQFDILEAHAAGAEIVTASYKCLKEMAFHPQTDKSVEGFLKDFGEWSK